MSIADHEAILLYSALAKPEKNKLKADDAPPEYYAVVAFPPSALDDLADSMKAVSESGSLAGLELAPKQNGTSAKPIPGIGDDWLITRMATQYAPELYLESGDSVAADPLNTTQIKGEFYSGQRVRVNARPFFWSHKKTNRRGVSLGLLGLMSVGGGDKRAGGNDSADAFGVSGKPAHTPQNTAPAQQTQAASDGNPFQQSGAPANPFA